jgi:hypothetical protein
MPQEFVVVTDGNTEAAARIEETIDHRTDTFAYVSGDGFEQWVKLCDEMKTPTYVLECTECGHTEVVDGEETRVGEKENALNSRGGAETLAKIHTLKSGHDPNIRVTA